MSQRQFIFLLALIALFTIPLPAYSQSCALCYTQAAASAAKFISALKSGIVILIVPPMFISMGITYLAYRKRNQFRSSDDGDSRDHW